MGIGLKRRRRSSEIVRGVDLEVFPGEKLGIVGESGSGKTLTVLSVLRLLPDPPVRLLRGQITFAGRDLGAMDDKALALSLIHILESTNSTSLASLRSTTFS